MAKIYTAQEMRRLILKIKGYLGGVVGKEDYEFLNRMADALEREEKREKKYEYAEKEIRDGYVYHQHEDTLNGAKNLQDENTVIVRREVGEWEEVCDGE